MKKTTMLRKLLAEEKLMVAVGVYDCLGAKVCEKAGFKAITMQGLSFSASLLGQPDVGLLTMTEVVNHARNIINAVNIPVLADIETGFGGIIQLQRTIREFERAGAACVRIEDQTYPFQAKGKGIIPMEEMITYVKAALDAREDPDLVICARTDADIISMDEIIKRCNAYADAGADLVMPIMPRPSNLERFKEVAKGVKAPLWVLLGGQGPTPKELESAGVRGVVSFSGQTLQVAYMALKKLAAEIKKNGTFSKTFAELGPITPEEIRDLMGLPGLMETERRFTLKK